MTILMMMTMLSAPTAAPVLLEARYAPVEGTDPEYGQGAIEKCDLRHAPVRALVWVIEVPAPGEPPEWEGRLNAAVKASHGRFTVAKATAEEEERVRSGQLVLQR